MANPPITILPYTNVPAPGSPIASAWAQQLTNQVVTLARGFVGRGTKSSDQAGFSGTELAISQLQVTVANQPTIRNMRMSYGVSVIPNNPAAAPSIPCGHVVFRLRIGSLGGTLAAAPILFNFPENFRGVTGYINITGEFTTPIAISAGAGAQIYLMTMATTGAPFTVGGGSWFTVEDIGGI